MLSEENKQRVKDGLSIIIDEHWVKIFPEDKQYQGQTIPINEMKISTPREAKKS